MAEEKQIPVFEMDHVCINGGDAQGAEEIAGTIAALFGLPMTHKPTSVYAGSGVEVAKAPGPGTHGHIGFAVRDIGEAVRWLESNGVAMDYDRRKFTQDGHLRLIYLKGEVGGFALHLIQK